MVYLETDQAKIVENLRQTPLANLVLLKYIQAFQSTALQLVDGDGRATLVITDHRYSSWDHKTYPDIATSIFVASRRPELTRELLSYMPSERPLVVKLFNDADRDILAGRYTLERRVAFLSFTGEAPTAPDAKVRFVSADADVPFSLFAAQGHDQAWLAPMLANGTAFACVIDHAGEPIAACFAFHIDAGIWEIGGVYVEHDHRGKGLATRLVKTAIARLQQQGLLFRYQAADSNTASIGLARKLGLHCYFTGTHYRAT